MSLDFEIQINDEYIETAVNAITSEIPLFLDGYGTAKADLKSDGSVVTEYDTEIEKSIISQLTENFPNSTVVAEESDMDKDEESDVVWIIDPIDGTINYNLGSLPSAIGIGIEIDGELYGGVIGMPLEGQVYYACSSEGAYRNEEELSVRIGDRRDQFVVGAELRPENLEIDGYYEMLETISEEMQTIRCVRSGLSDSCHIASGRLHAAVNVETNPWDVAPATILVREAGGTVTNLEGSSDWDDIKKGEAVFSTGEEHDYLLQFFD